MSATTGLEVFDRSIHATNAWLADLAQALGPDRQRAYHALRAVLHALRDRLTVEEAAHLGAQLPTMIRGIYYEGWRPAQVPAKVRSKKAFLERVGQELTGIGPMNPEDAASAVFGVLEKHVTQGELDDVRHMLPEPVRELWPRAA